MGSCGGERGWHTKWAQDPRAGECDRKRGLDDIRMKIVRAFRAPSRVSGLGRSVGRCAISQPRSRVSGIGRHTPTKADRLRSRGSGIGRIRDLLLDLCGHTPLCVEDWMVTTIGIGLYVNCNETCGARRSLPAIAGLDGDRTDRRCGPADAGLDGVRVNTQALFRSQCGYGRDIE